MVNGTLPPFAPRLTATLARPLRLGELEACLSISWRHVMGKFRVAVRDEIDRQDLRRYALRWAAFAAAAVAVIAGAMMFSR